MIDIGLRRKGLVTCTITHILQQRHIAVAGQYFFLGTIDWMQD